MAEQIEKLFGRTCPKCGEIYQECQLTAPNLGSGVQANMRCANGHMWSEFYNLTYTGFWWLDRRYDSFGNEIKDDRGT